MDSPTQMTSFGQYPDDARIPTTSTDLLPDVNNKWSGFRGLTIGIFGGIIVLIILNIPYFIILSRQHQQNKKEKSQSSKIIKLFGLISGIVCVILLVVWISIFAFKIFSS